MLVYVNQFKLEGRDSIKEAFQLVSKWLTKSVGCEVSVNFLKSGKEKTYKNKFVIRTYIANNLEPFMYSVLFSRPDNKVMGRQWVTEIGIKTDKKETLISILLEISDVSTQVKELPKTTKPNLVALLNSSRYLSKSTIGLKVSKLKNDLNEFKALDYEINRENREYSIVLVSKRKQTKDFLLDPYKIQEQLIGLAKVVIVDESINDGDLKSYIGNHSVWDGAVRIIYPSGFIRSKLLRSIEIRKISDDKDNIYHELLSFITHKNNSAKKRNHFRPTDVVAKRSRDTIKLLRDSVKDAVDYEELAEKAFLELGKQEEVFNNKRDELKKEIENLELRNLQLEDEIMQLKKNNLALENRIKYSKRDREVVMERGARNNGILSLIHI